MKFLRELVEEYGLIMLISALSLSAIIVLNKYSENTQDKLTQDKLSNDRISSISTKNTTNDTNSTSIIKKNMPFDEQLPEKKQSLLEKIPMPQGAETIIAISAAVANNNSEEEIKVRSKEIGNFSDIPQDYKIIKAVNALGMRGIVASYPNSKQYMAVVDTGNVLNITKSDLQTGRAEEELLEYGKKMLPPNIKVTKLDIIPQGSIHAFDQSVPCAEMRIKLEGINSNRTYRGFVGIATSPRDNKDHIIFSMNERGYYDKKIAENYYKSVTIY